MARGTSQESSPERRISPAAVASLLLGLASPFLLILAGVPAVWLGVHAIRTVNAADGRLRGRRLALAGIALGGVGCAGAVLGLLAIVVFTLRDRSHRVECENNLRQIGVAVGNYYTTNDSYPPGTLPNPALPPEKRLSWLAALPPYFGQKTKEGDFMHGLRLDLSQAWDADPNAESAHGPVPYFPSPAHRFLDRNVALGATEYVGLAGVGRNAAELPLTDPSAGLFGYDRIVRRDDLKAGDSRTLMATETTRDNGPWTAGGPPTVRGLDPADLPYIGPGRAFGGFHPGGLNVLFADGSAEFMTDDVSPGLFQSLTLLRREGAPPGP